MEVLTSATNAAAGSSAIRTGEAQRSAPTLTAGEKLAAYYDLTKPRITFLVVLSALAGFALGSPSPINWLLFLHTALGIALLSSGISTLNQCWEWKLDALMERTKSRPLPMGKLTSRGAVIFGIGISLIAEIYLAWLVNPLTAVWGFIALASYLFIYTPLKTRTHWCTFIGAIPGALPPLLGWAAARGEVGLEAWTLFGILFFWQFPHFHAIATMYREDYGQAGIRMLPVIEPDGKATARQIIAYTIGLVAISLLPTLLGISGWVYLAGAVVLGAWFLHASLTTAKQMNREQARHLLKVSVMYLPLLLGLMVLNR
ncbi:MAG TPA: heme o synthase [Blastocatellia bacterium]|nr:heme o synthase [Blastocatellia bacterium]HMV87557.1 heme o synthase [Blastocatellia bacterium]HMX27626.1 heme o synthase [Blastocatellia bacterium]